MEPDIIFRESFENIILDINTLYIIFGYGTGDTFNAIVHLRKAPPAREYALIVKRPQLNLVKFLMASFEHRPSQIIAIDYWNHDFAQQLFIRFPSLPHAQGLQPHMTWHGLLSCWLNPYNYNKVIPLDDRFIQEMVAYFRATPPTAPLPDNAVVFFPTAGANFSEYIPPWTQIVATLKEKGIKDIYINKSNIPEYGDESIDGAKSISLAHDELIRTFYAEGSHINIIAVRSGAIDILRFSGQKALVLYQPIPEGIFSTCRFGLLQNNLDLIEAICLNISKEHQDDTIKYYVENFISLPLAR